MYQAELYLRVRRACMVDGMSTREASRVFSLHRDTVRKMLAYSVPPGYRRRQPPRRPRIGPYTGVIDRILEDDLNLPRKQRHTAKRIYDRLRDEYGFDGRYTIVKDYVREGSITKVVGRGGGGIEVERTGLILGQTQTHPGRRPVQGEDQSNAGNDHPHHTDTRRDRIYQ